MVLRECMQVAVAPSRRPKSHWSARVKWPDVGEMWIY